MTTLDQLRDYADDVTGRLTAEGLKLVNMVAPLFGRGRHGSPAHPSSIIRRGLKGVRLPDGTKLRLEMVNISGRWYPIRCPFPIIAGPSGGRPPSGRGRSSRGCRRKVG